MKTIEQGCARIHWDVKRWGLRFGGRKEDNKEVPIVRDDRECYKSCEHNELGSTIRKNVKCVYASKSLLFRILYRKYFANYSYRGDNYAFLLRIQNRKETKTY